MLPIKRLPTVLGMTLTTLLTVGVVQAIEPARLAPADLTDRAVAVRVSLTVGGDLIVAPQSDPQPVRVEVMTEYLQTPGPGEGVLRRYEQGALTVAKETRSTIDPTRGVVLAQLLGGRVECRAERIAFSRSELDLVEAPADPLTTAGLFPTVKVAPGDRWTLEADTLGPLLKLDSVSVCEVTAVLTDLTASHARFRMAGTVHGSVAGATTEIDLRGVGLIDRQTRILTQLNLGLEERRAIGPASPGLDVAAKLSLRCEPLSTTEATEAVAAAAGNGTATSEVDGRFSPAGLVRIQSNDNAWETLASRDWHLTAQTRKTLALRAAEGQEPLATMLLRTVASRHAKDLAAFTAEVQSQVEPEGGRLGAFEERITPSGLTCFTVVVLGKAEGIPTEWHHYLLQEPLSSAPAVSAVTRIAESDRQRFAEGDRLLIDALTLTPSEATASHTGSSLR